jgi:hypothetical protein
MPKARRDLSRKPGRVSNQFTFAGIQVASYLLDALPGESFEYGNGGERIKL